MFDSWHSSLWSDHREVMPNQPVTGPAAHDIVIIGGGYTGLWTAYYLSELLPHKDIAVIDGHQPGFGASGRNGGWCSALFPVSLQSLSERTSRDAAIAMQHALHNTVKDIEATVNALQIDCDWHVGGTLTAITNPVHEHRINDYLNEMQSFGFSDDDYTFLSAEELRERMIVNNGQGAMYSPHCAVIHPLKLVNGLVHTLQNRGVHFYTHSQVVSYSRGKVLVHSEAGDNVITADWVVQATEGFTRSLRGHKRDTIPLYSYMIATEPLPEDTWKSIGWENRETFSDARNMIIYAQRTGDGRIAFGGRGARYRYNSAISPSYDVHNAIHRRIINTMHDIFPATRDAEITHKWGGALGINRDWHPSVHANTTTHVARAGGYVGDGVAAAHLAGQTIAELISGSSTARTSLPWVQHESPRWEPEPLRWVGVNTMLRLPLIADRHERKHQTRARRIERMMDRFHP